MKELSDTHFAGTKDHRSLAKRLLISFLYGSLDNFCMSVFVSGCHAKPKIGVFNIAWHWPLENPESSQ